MIVDFGLIAHLLIAPLLLVLVFVLLFIFGVLCCINKNLKKLKKGAK